MWARARIEQPRRSARKAHLLSAQGQTRRHARATFGYASAWRPGGEGAVAGAADRRVGLSKSVAGCEWL